MRGSAEGGATESRDVACHQTLALEGALEGRDLPSKGQRAYLSTQPFYSDAA